MAISNSIRTVAQAQAANYSAGDLVKISFGTVTNPERSGNEHWFTYYEILPSADHKDSLVSLRANPNGDGTYRGTLFNATFIIPLTTAQITDIADNNVNFDNYNVVYDVDRKIFGSFSAGADPLSIQSGGGSFTPIGEGSDEATAIKLLSHAQALALDYTKYTLPIVIKVYGDDFFAEYTTTQARMFAATDSIVEFKVSDTIYLTNISNNIGTLKGTDAEGLAALNTNGFLNGKIFTDITDGVAKYFDKLTIKPLSGGGVAEADVVKISSIAQAKAIDFSIYTQPFDVLIYTGSGYSGFLFSVDRSFSGDNIVEFPVTGGFLTNFYTSLGGMTLDYAETLAALNTSGFLDGKTFIDQTNKVQKYWSGIEIKSFAGATALADLDDVMLTAPILDLSQLLYDKSIEKWVNKNSSPSTGIKNRNNDMVIKNRNTDSPIQNRNVTYIY